MLTHVPQAKPVSESWSLELRNILTSMLQKVRFSVVLICYCLRCFLSVANESSNAIKVASRALSTSPSSLLSYCCITQDPDNRPSTKEILATPYMEQHGGRIEGKLGPANYVRGLSQLTQGVQPMLTDICSEVSIACYVKTF